jgi:ElaB/YqjD/DUF883 family membrane-anchored ribosome-binding protein
MNPEQPKKRSRPISSVKSTKGARARTKKQKSTMSEEPIPETASGNESAARFSDGKQHASQAVHDLRAAAEAKAAEFRATAEGKVHEIRGKAEHAYSEARTRAQTLRGESEHWIRENPTRAVLTAIGVGFILGLMFRK